MRSIPRNNELRLVFSDVDETVADLYRPAEARMVLALARLLNRGIRLVLITGQSCLCEKCGRAQRSAWHSAAL
jgi:hypothetical protein